MLVDLMQSDPTEKAPSGEQSSMLLQKRNYLATQVPFGSEDLGIAAVLASANEPPRKLADSGGGCSLGSRSDTPANF